MPTESRKQLAQLQRSFVEALVVENIAVPEGFDSDQVRAAAEALRRKRARAVARAWPRLSRALGNRFDLLFREFAARHQLPAGADSLADGRLFAGFLAQGGLLPDEGRREAMAFDLHFILAEGRIVRRRWPRLATALRSVGRQLVSSLNRIHVCRNTTHPFPFASGVTRRWLRPRHNRIGVGSR